MIEHRDRGCNRGRMSVRQVDGAGAKPELPGRRREPCDESDAGRNVLGSVGDVLANIGFGEAEFIGQQESLAILLERKPPILVDGMDRHRKEPELHGLLFPRQAFVWHRTCVVRRMKTSSKSK